MRAQNGMPERIRIRVFSEEKIAIEEAARRNGVTLSDFIRDLAVRASGVAA